MKLVLNDSELILPESSFSANYLNVNLKKAFIYIKEINEIPKIMMNLNDQIDSLLIIDKKFTFNVKSILTGNTNLIPNSKIELIAYKVLIHFFINQQHDFLGNFQKFSLIIKSPKICDIYHFRLDEWKKYYGKFCIVTIKPSMRFKIDTANIETNIVTFDT